MSYKIEAIAEFQNRAKRLSKKYPSFRDDLAALGRSLSINPEQGVSLGKNCYKVRLSIASKGKGKSGGMRVITLVVKIDETVNLLTVYDKSEEATVTDKELKRLIQEAGKNSGKK